MKCLWVVPSGTESRSVNFLPLDLRSCASVFEVPLSDNGNDDTDAHDGLINSTDFPEEGTRCSQRVATLTMERAGGFLPREVLAAHE